ncbi:transposase [Paenibacillus pasadenensis]|uniref:transposase n=1 Tax=Paenibacillus pasadenensis TaxID=217090 RepID=UPI003EBBA8B4
MNDANQTWTLSDEFWQMIKDELPKPTKRDPNRTYKRKPGGGRKPTDLKNVLEGILFVLRTGCQWNAHEAMKR